MVAQLRPALRAALVDPGRPQLVLRMGIPDSHGSPTARRPVEDVIVPHERHEGPREDQV